MRAIKSLLSSLLLSLLLAACTTNPVTGERQLVSMMSAKEEAAAGAAAHPKIIAAFGGVYDDPQLGMYVAGVTQRLASASGRPVSYRITILDTPVVNAFALPGGYVYVTRGLLALAGDEAELASVLGHEIGHVDARHSAQRQTAAMGASVLGAVLGAVVGSQAASQVVGSGGQGLLAGYSRDQEFEADMLGVGALFRAGYDPYAGASFLDKMGAEEELKAQMSGKRSADKSDWLASHPATPARVATAKEHASETGAKPDALPRHRDAYLDAIDGMIYGDSPAQGMIRGRDFVHPEMRFAFTAPRGFMLVNAAQAVGIQGPSKTVAKFDAATKSAEVDIKNYLASQWASQVQIANLRAFNLGGMRAAEARARVGNYNARLIAIEYSPTQVYRFLIGILPEMEDSHGPLIDQMVGSFRRLNVAEASSFKPYRLRIVTVQPGQKVGELASRMQPSQFQEERFRVLNGLRPDERLTPGMRVKIVSE